MKASTFCCLLSWKKILAESNQPIRKSLTSKEPTSNRLTRSYDETRLTNSSNVKLSISVHYQGLFK
jgi:hypothetical protein